MIDQFDNDGLTFDVLDSGPADGEPVVLLHGFPERASSWELVVPRLHEQGYRTIAPDQRGYSPGARPARVRDYTVQAIVGDLGALIETIGRPVHVVGHDWGAVVAWYAAATFPEHVRTLTALSVPHPGAYFRSARQAAKAWYVGMFDIPWLPERMARRPGGAMDRLLAGYAGMLPDDIARYRRDVVEYGALTGGLNWYRATVYSLRDAPGTVSVPTTHVWSSGDRALDQLPSLKTARYCTGPYTYVQLPGVSHWIPRHAPEAAADAILARVGRCD